MFSILRLYDLFLQLSPSQPYTSFIPQPSQAPINVIPIYLPTAFIRRHFLSDCYFRPDTPTDSTPTSMRPILPHSHHNSRILEFGCSPATAAFQSLAVCLPVLSHPLHHLLASLLAICKPTYSHFCTCFVLHYVLPFRFSSIHRSDSVTPFIHLSQFPSPPAF